MALNFPSSPYVGLTHDAANGLQYYYDGTKWISQSSYSTGAINAQKIDSVTLTTSTGPYDLKVDSKTVKPHNAESVLISVNGVIQQPTTDYTVSSTAGTITFTSAPTNGHVMWGVLYSRIPIDLSTALSTTGGTMTGDITFASSQTLDASKLTGTAAAINGSAITTLSGTNITTGTVSSDYVEDASISRQGVVQLTDSTNSTSTTTAATPNSVKDVKDSIDAALPKSGGTMTGAITLPGNPTADLHASTKAYVDSVSGATSITQLSDVDTTTSVPSSGEVLKWDGSNWAPAADSGSGGGGTMTTVKSNNSNVDTSVTTIDFDSNFVVSESPDHEMNVTLSDITLNDQKDLRFGEATANGSNYVAFQAPAAITSNVTWTLPAADGGGANYRLVTDGSGTLSWAAASQGVTVIDAGDFNSGSSIVSTSTTYDGGEFT